MPSSSHQQISLLVEILMKVNPMSMIDIGVGFGKYGFLAREYLELWDGRESYSEFKRTIDGIEAFPQYLTPVHRFVYDRIFEGDASRIVPTLERKYDLAIMIDSLEHFGREDGLRLLGELTRKASHVLIAVPKHIGVQEDAFGNPYEIHRYQWKRSDFEPFRPRVFLSSKESLICFIGPDAERVSRSVTPRTLGHRLRNLWP
jgi:hypothetical protein